MARKEDMKEITENALRKVEEHFQEIIEIMDGVSSKIDDGINFHDFNEIAEQIEDEFNSDVYEEICDMSWNLYPNWAPKAKLMNIMSETQKKIDNLGTVYERKDNEDN